MLKMTTVSVALAMTVGAGMASAYFTEGFESSGSIPAGWAEKNASNPLGSVAWNIAVLAATPFSAQAGDNYARVNFNSTTGAGTISNWLFTQVDTIKNGDTLSFWTRTVDGPAFPDRLQVRLSTNGASTNTGVGSAGVGDFSTLLLDINPTLTTTGYPDAWTQYSINISGLAGPVSGRFAFRYFVTNVGPLGDNSDFIGVDSVAFVPAPGAAALLGLGGLVVARRRRA